MRLACLCLTACLAFAQPKPPGVVIAYQPASTGQYIGSPGIVILPNGNYIAKHDLFGPKSTENTEAVTRLYYSSDRGAKWSLLSEVKGMYWASVFFHRNALYLIGTHHQYGNLVIMRSKDTGRTWTEPKDEHTGILAEGRYHTAPTPILVHKGRLWRAFEDAQGPGGWGSHFRAFVMSIPEKADLLERSNWTFTNVIGRDPAWLEGDFLGWLEGNAVATREGDVVDILRVDVPKRERAAVIKVSKDGKQASFDPATGFVSFPGGAKKFTIRYDSKTKRYWCLANPVAAGLENRKPASVRNTLALVSSKDLVTWQQGPTILRHDDVLKHAFQYVDWQFEGADLIVASRTAYDDGEGGAHNAHDANYLTFHRIVGWRQLLAGNTGR